MKPSDDAPVPTVDPALLDEAWPAAEPPAGFAARVAARARDKATPPRRRLRYVVAGGLMAAAAAAAAALLLLSPSSPSSGSFAGAERASIVLGGRGVAVAEAGARFTWRVAAGGAARLEQTAGDVFYRVERGGPFVVSTPAGEVRVQGTCFRVEVGEMSSKSKTLLSMGAGAALASAVLVTVYEGKVLLANEKGQATLGAGEEAAMAAGAPPGEPASARAPKRAALAPPTPAEAPPAADATREALLARDQVQRAEIARLRGELAAAAAHKGEGKARGPESPFFAPSPEELGEMAKQCKLKWDHPSLGSTPPTLTDDRARSMGMNPEERAEYERLGAEMHRKVSAELRKLYLEVTGDKGGAESLNPWALETEILEKSPESVVPEVFRRLAQERAGLSPPPRDASGQSPAERMMRLITSLGDRFEDELGKAIGADRARALREANNGWHSRSTSSHGCPR
jgi:hypothetical protein